MVVLARSDGSDLTFNPKTIVNQYDKISPLTQFYQARHQDVPETFQSHMFDFAYSPEVFDVDNQPKYLANLA
ncbi:hypothetical protein RRG08_035245 [Elysia crispata]|uniref:Uncharacterized protein n=1 Tax=Elysia crispata TaxID=231223 RepID=A0AAE0ZMR5_9GAST|nr:hypothetical protein RRG08_035245 [Elysia crispata]